MHGTALADAGKAGADLHALDGVDAHHGVGDVGIKLVKQRLPQAHRHAGGDHADARAAGVAGLAQGVHVSLERRHIGRRCKKRVIGNMRPGLKGHGQVANLSHATHEACAVLRRQPLFGDSAGGHHRCRQAGRRATAATRVAQAVFVQVGVVGVTGAEGVQDIAVVLAALVGVLDQQTDRRACGLAFVNAGEDFDRIGLVALRHVPAGAGPAAVQVVLDVGFSQIHPWRAAVDHAADGRAVGFTEVGDCEKLSEGVAAHGH